MARLSRSPRGHDSGSRRPQSKPNRVGRRPPALPYALPEPATPLIGRDADLQMASQQLLQDRTRLLTFTGPPGIGKTRLAAHVASHALSEFKDGVHYVDLAAITDPQLVVHAIGRTLGMADMSHEPMAFRLKRYLQKRQMLLVLDNFEQVIDAAQDIADLLAACAGLQILVTSREPLHVGWEHEFSVQPLALPNLSEAPALEALARFPAVKLFTERAQAVNRKFALTGDNGRAVAEVCVRLDGIPLAIELAAAQTKFLQPPAILERLRESLALLSTARRDTPARHHTLRGAIGWSYNLLGSRDQMLLRRLAVFVGSMPLDGAEAVSDADADRGGSVLDRIAALVDKSLLQLMLTRGATRFVMLEAIREFGLDRLTESGEKDDIQRRHAAFFLDVAERAETTTRAAEPPELFDRLEWDIDNIRAVLEYLLASGDPEGALRLAGALRPFWQYRGYFREGLAWLERALLAGGGSSPAARRKALAAAGLLASWLQDHGRAATWAEEALALAKQAGDSQAVADSQFIWAQCLGARGGASFPGHQEGLRMARKLGEKRLTCTELLAVGRGLCHQGDYQHSLDLLEQGLALAREVGPYQTSLALRHIGVTKQHLGLHAEAETLFTEGLVLTRSARNRWAMPYLLEGLGGTALAHGHFGRAATLLGAAGFMRKVMGTPVHLRSRGEFEATVRGVQAGMSSDAFAAASAAGQAMSFDEAIDYALTPVEGARAHAATPGARSATRHSAELSKREREVAALIAQGLSNRRIGAELKISEKTAEAHVQNILNKLGFHSRSQIAAWAGERRLNPQ